MIKSRQNNSSKASSSGTGGRLLIWGRMICFLVLALISFPRSERENTGISDLSEFAGIVLLDKGRKKPIDTYAGSMLLKMSGQSTFGKKSALRWLLELLFNSENTRKDKVFMVNNMEVIYSLGLKLEPSRRFSYGQLEPGLAKLSELASEASKIIEADRTIVQSEVMRLYHILDMYISHAAAFQFLAPQKDFIINDPALAEYLDLRPSPAQNSYFDLFSKALRLHQALAAVQGNPGTYRNDFEKSLVDITRKMYSWSQYYKTLPVYIIPQPGQKNETWLSPWDAVNNPRNYAGSKNELSALSRICRAYLNGDQTEFNRASIDFKTAVRKKTEGSVDYGDIVLEIKYNKYRFFMWAKLVCGLGLLAALSSLVWLRKPMYITGFSLLAASLIPLTLGIFFRILIMNRPPVTDLYESLIAVSWICAVLGLAVEKIQKNTIGLITAGFSSLAMLLIADKYALEGDTFGVLVAVLNSNFWLTTHVITISMGYAGCCAGGVAGHIYMVQKLFNIESSRLRDTYKSVYGLLAFGLVFSFIGTILGGIWADQSWGRFWGWDPKENGALLVVLWCSLLFHARLGGLIGELGMAAGGIIAGVIVMLAWFGVNLLGVGLHSYGFSTGAFIKLFSYIAVELLFILITTTWIMLKKRPVS